MYLRKKTFVTLFIVGHITFIFLQIYNHTKYIQQTYKKQSYEKKHDILREEEQKLIQQLYTLKDQTTIKQFAQNTLHMQSNKLNQVKKIKKS